MPEELLAGVEVAYDEADFRDALRQGRWVTTPAARIPLAVETIDVYRATVRAYRKAITDGRRRHGT